MSSIKISEIEDISQVTPPKEYVDIWKEISYKVQKQKPPPESQQPAPTRRNWNKLLAPQTQQ